MNQLAVQNTRLLNREQAWSEFDKWQQKQAVYYALPPKRYNLKVCFYCNKGWAKGRKRTRQHLLPKRRGGLYEPQNLRWCCALCNHLLSIVDDCPVILNTYKAIVADTPLRHLPLKLGFSIYVAMRNDKSNPTVMNLLEVLVENLKDKTKRRIAKDILMYMKLAFPGDIRMALPKEEIPIIFPKK